VRPPSERRRMIPTIRFLVRYTAMVVHCKAMIFARDVTYTSRAYVTMSVSVCLSVCDGSALAHYSSFTFQIPIQIYRALSSRGGVISTTKSRTMLATAKPSCSLNVMLISLRHFTVCLRLAFFLQFAKLQPVTNRA